MSLTIIHGLENMTRPEKGLVATIGTFDGIHRGHKAIIEQLEKGAAKIGLPSLMITFEPHPRTLVTPDSPPLLLTCTDEKIKILEEIHDGMLLVLRFNRQLMNMTAEEFARDILIEKLNVKKLIVGYDHAFGRNRSGTINDLMNLSRLLSFSLEVVDPVIVGGRPISSTRIRRLIEGHNLSAAIDLLGHPYPAAGTVRRGIGLGKKIGYPTANLEYNPRKLLPKDGVYSCRVEIDERSYHGMMFIGKNHFNPDLEKSFEVNIFDFDRDIYDKEIFCYPEIYIRENRKYDDPSQLVEQLKLDKQKVLMLKNRGDS